MTNQQFAEISTDGTSSAATASRARSQIGAKVVGVLFGAAAVGNAIWTVSIAESFLEWLRDGAWVPPYPWFLGQLVPVAALVVGMTVAFEAMVAVLLWIRRYQELGLWLATGWVFALIPAIAYPYWLTNLVVGAVIAVLAVAVHVGRDNGTVGATLNAAAGKN